MSAQTCLTRVCSSLLFCVLALSLPHSIKADEIAIWNFNDSDLVVDHGSGTLTTNFNLINVVFTLGGSTLNSRQGDPAGQSMTLQGGTSTANNGRSVTLEVSTIGYANIVISFATQGTSTGFTTNQLQYSLDGKTFVDFGAPYSPPTTFTVISFDLSAITALNNNPNAVLRIVFDGATSSSGNNRIDNLVVEGQSLTVPEPASMFLMGVGLMGLAARLRRKKDDK